MKTTIFKTFILAAALLFAISGAFASRNSVKRAHATVTGYIDNPFRCQLAVDCSDIPGQYCTALVGSMTYQVYGKVSPTAPICSQVLYRP